MCAEKWPFGIYDFHLIGQEVADFDRYPAGSFDFDWCGIYKNIRLKTEDI